MRTAKLKLFYVATAVLMMAGCAVQKPAPDAGPDSEAYARKLIVSKVDAAVQAQQQLAAVTEEGRAAVARKQGALDTDTVDLDYVGKPQPLLESIAYRYGYRYVEAGKRADLAFVNVKVSRQPVQELLRNISYQIDGGADVVLDKDAKIIRLVYKPLKG